MVARGGSGEPTVRHKNPETNGRQKKESSTPCDNRKKRSFGKAEINTVRDHRCASPRCQREKKGVARRGPAPRNPKGGKNPCNDVQRRERSQRREP